MQPSLKSIVQQISVADPDAVLLATVLLTILLEDDLNPNELEILGNSFVDVGQLLLTVASLQNYQRELAQKAAEAAKAAKEKGKAGQAEGEQSTKAAGEDKPEPDKTTAELTKKVAELEKKYIHLYTFIEEMNKNIKT